MTKPLLALSMIVKDEAKSIAKVIESCRGVIDYALIMDTGSSDETVTIAEKTLSDLSIPGRVVHDTFEGFAATRNKALDLSEKEAQFSLILSGDEFLRNTESIRPMLASAPETVDIFVITTQLLYTNACNNITRIIRSDVGVRYEGNIHESIVNDRQAMYIPALILHDDSYMSVPELRMNRLLRDKKILLDEIEQGRRVPYMLGYLFSVYLSLKEYQEIILLAEKYKDSVTPETMRLLMVAQIKLGIDPKPVFDQILEKVGPQTNVVYDYALYLHRNGQHQTAIEYAVYCAAVEDNTLEEKGVIVDIGVVTWKPHWLIASCAKALGDKETMTHACASAAEESKNDPRVLRMLQKIMLPSKLESDVSGDIGSIKLTAN